MAPPQRRSGRLPADLAGGFLTAAAGGYAWWSSSSAVNTGADVSALKRASAPSAPASPARASRGTAVTVAGRQTLEGTYVDSLADQAIGMVRQQRASSASGNGDGNAASGASGALAARLSKSETEAMDLVVAELASHYLKTPEGSTTAVSESINPPFTSTTHFLRQFRELTPDGVDADEVGAADRLNGFEWEGAVSFKASPAREAGDPGLAFTHDLLPLAVGVFVYRAKGGGWTRWVDLQPGSVRVVKLNGVWKLPKGSSLLSGQRPTPEDFQRAGAR